MNAIDKIYNPYNFSSTRCYVLIVEPKGKTLAKIEHKLPGYIKRIKGICVTSTLSSNVILHIGLVSLNFNGNALKSFHFPVPNTYKQPEISNPINLDELIQPNSFIQGYFFGVKSPAKFYTVSIYIHYDYDRQ